MPGLCKIMLKLRVSACDSEVRLALNYALHVSIILELYLSVCLSVTGGRRMSPRPLVTDWRFEAQRKRGRLRIGWAVSA